MAFYGGLLGWSYRDEDIGSARYHLALGKGLPAAGIEALQPGEVTSWTSYFAVDDADVTAARIGDEGGTVLHPPSPLGSLGRRVIAADPTGARFGIWETGEHFGAALVNEHGGLNWNELITDDMERATHFYEAVFGYESQTEDWGEGRSYTTFEVGGRGVSGCAVKPGPQIPNHWNVYFAVDDATTAIDYTVAGAGEVLGEAREIENVGVMARLADPYAAPFFVIQLTMEID